MRNNRIVTLISGGIDSTTLLFWLLERNYEVYPLYVNYGQIPAPGELTAIRSILDNNLSEKLAILDIENIRKIGTGTLAGQYPEGIYSLENWFNNEFFPNRNLLLITLAATYAYKISAYKIAIGVTGQNSYKDTTRLFLQSTTSLLRESLCNNFEIIAPFSDKPREAVIKQAIRVGAPLEKTFSCNALGDRHCLLCTSCIEHEVALDLLRKL